MSAPTHDTTKNRNHLISFLTHEETLGILTEISSRLEDGAQLIACELDELVRETFDIRKREEAEKVDVARRSRAPRNIDLEEEDWG